MMEPQHPLLTSLHPQFVAAKSLILIPPEFFLHFIVCGWLGSVTENFFIEMNRVSEGPSGGAWVGANVPGIRVVAISFS